MTNTDNRAAGDQPAAVALTTEHGEAPRRWRTLTVAAVFGLFYLWDIIEAVGNLIALLNFARLIGGSVSSFAWLVLGLGVVFPPLAYVFAIVSARRHGILLLSLALLTGLAAAACLGLVIEALLN